MPSRTDERRFKDLIGGQLSDELLDTVIDWIATELEPEEVFEEKKLNEWAEANGYVKE